MFFYILKEITGLKGEIAQLRQALEDSKKRNLEAQAQHEGLQSGFSLAHSLLFLSQFYLCIIAKFFVVEMALAVQMKI